MNKRSERLELGPAWKGTLRHDTLGLIGEGEFVSLEFFGGARVRERLFTGAIAVVRDDAFIVDEMGVPIPAESVVICRKHVLNGTAVQLQNRIGVPVEAVDPGPNCPSYVLPWSTEKAPTITKIQCRKIGKCIDTTLWDCRNCCNHK